MVKNKDRVDNQTCTVVENWQEKSHFGEKIFGAKIQSLNTPFER